MHEAVKRSQKEKKMGKESLHVTDETFQKEVLESDVPVLVEFWAAWCGPCRMIAPIIEELAADYDGRVVVAKLDVDENINTASKYGTMTIPTMIIFKGGEEVKRMIGARPKKVIADWLDASLEPSD
jgi:thioredoxin 1